MPQLKNKSVAAAGGANKKPRLNHPLASKFDVVEKALGQASDLPESVRKMLIDILLCSLGKPQDQRHPFQTEMVNTIGQTLNHTAEGLQGNIAMVEKQLQEVRKQEDVRKDEYNKESERLFEKQEVTEKAKVDLANVALAFREAKKAFQEAKAFQKREDAELEACLTKKQQLEAAAQDLLSPLTTGSAETSNVGKMIDEVVKLLNAFGFEESLVTALKPALHKAPADRGDFDLMCFKELNDEVSKRITEFDTTLQAGEAGKKERAAAVEAAEAAFNAARETQNTNAGLYTRAQSEQEEVNTVMNTATKELKDLAQQVKTCNTNFNKAKSRLETFNGGPLAAFKELDDYHDANDEAMKEGETYYKIIDGAKYDRALLEAVEKFAADGQVGYPEAKQLWHEAEDGKGVTDIEKATLEYSMKTYKFTEKAANFIKTYLEAGAHKSYYKVIDGVKYDRILLEDAMVDAADGQVSWKEAKQLFADAQDGKGLTGTEKDTFEYILKTMKFTNKARAYLTNQLQVPNPKSYYKIIDGVKYDHALLLECESSCKDGVISEAEAKRLYEEACDGKGVTEIEAGTLKYALKTFKFTDGAKQFLTNTLGA